MTTTYVPVPRAELAKAVGIIKAVREFLLRHCRSELTDKMLEVESGLWVHATNPFTLDGMVAEATAAGPDESGMVG